jgi:hypothetical protein
MASVAVGMKRSFASMSNEEIPSISSTHRAGDEALASHLRNIKSAERTRNPPNNVALMLVLIDHSLETI